MEESYGANIVLFPRSGNTSEEVHADVDKTLSHNLLSKTVLDRLKLQCTPCQAAPLTDKKGRNHIPIGQIELVWHKPDYHEEHTEIFYVVKSGLPDVILKGSGNGDHGIPARPIMNQVQSTDEEKRQAQKKVEAEKKRAEEEQKRAEDREKQQGQEK
ncbi:MAG: hypothetical protein Q9223_002281 [Gallowayella weberi]